MSVAHAYVANAEGRLNETKREPFHNEGTRPGAITDYHVGQPATTTAPAAGILLILFGTPPVNVGDPIVVIGRVNSE